ncbi:MAG TPA: sugar ABC transporter permease [Thermotogaceae bacterium]|nr:sugar ABC transporter permease [Thermotogaceae bacterium]
MSWALSPRHLERGVILKAKVLLYIVAIGVLVIFSAVVLINLDSFSVKIRKASAKEIAGDVATSFSLLRQNLQTKLEELWENPPVLSSVDDYTGLTLNGHIKFKAIALFSTNGNVISRNTDDDFPMKAITESEMFEAVAFEEYPYNSIIFDHKPMLVGLLPVYNLDGDPAILALGVNLEDLIDLMDQSEDFQIAIYDYTTKTIGSSKLPKSLDKNLFDVIVGSEEPVVSSSKSDIYAISPIKDYMDWDIIGAFGIKEIFYPIKIFAVVILITFAFASVILTLYFILAGRCRWKAVFFGMVIPVLAVFIYFSYLTNNVTAEYAKRSVQISSKVVTNLQDIKNPISRSIFFENQILSLPLELTIIDSSMNLIRTTMNNGESSRTMSFKLKSLTESDTGIIKVGNSLHVATKISLDDTFLILSKKLYKFQAPGKMNSLVVGITLFITMISLALISFAGINISRRRYLSESFGAFAFLLPSFIHLMIFGLAPIGFALYLSFHQWNIVIPEKPFVGFDNYVKLFGDKFFWNAMKNTAIYTLHVPIGMAFSLFVAVLLNQRIKGISLFRTILFLPSVSSFVAVAMIWQFMYNPEFGLLNVILSKLGLPQLNWLGDPKIALISVMIVSIWSQIGYQMVIFLAGLQGIPAYLYEAAKIDGSNKWQMFWKITLPLLRPTTLFVLITSVIGSFQVFTSIYIMTQGGPLRSTDVVVYHIYKNAWEYMKMGYASAMAWILTIIIFIATLLQIKFLGKDVSYT